MVVSLLYCNMQLHYVPCVPDHFVEHVHYFAVLTVLCTRTGDSGRREAEKRLALQSCCYLVPKGSGACLGIY